MYRNSCTEAPVLLLLHDILSNGISTTISKNSSSNGLTSSRFGVGVAVELFCSVGVTLAVVSPINQGKKNVALV
jgi:hypothetical protein